MATGFTDTIHGLGFHSIAEKEVWEDAKPSSSKPDQWGVEFVGQKDDGSYWYVYVTLTGNSGYEPAKITPHIVSERQLDQAEYDQRVVKYGGIED